MLGVVSLRINCYVGLVVGGVYKKRTRLGGKMFADWEVRAMRVCLGVDYQWTICVVT